VRPFLRGSNALIGFHGVRRKELGVLPSRLA
jgi:hypothetical protein